MKSLNLLLALAVLCVSSGAQSPTNLLAIYCVKDRIPLGALLEGRVTPKELKLVAEPILSDADFVAFDTTNHTFAITPQAAKRWLYRMPYETPFVLAASGEAIYVGVYSSPGSSRVYHVPTIWSKSPLVGYSVSTTNEEFSLWLVSDASDDAQKKAQGVLEDRRISSAVSKLFGSRKFRSK